MWNSIALGCKTFIHSHGDQWCEHLMNMWTKQNVFFFILFRTFYTLNSLLFLSLCLLFFSVIFGERCHCRTFPYQYILLSCPSPPKWMRDFDTVGSSTNPIKPVRRNLSAIQFRLFQFVPDHVFFIFSFPILFFFFRCMKWRNVTNNENSLGKLVEPTNNFDLCNSQKEEGKRKKKKSNNKNRFLYKTMRISSKRLSSTDPIQWAEILFSFTHTQTPERERANEIREYKTKKYNS